VPRQDNRRRAPRGRVGRPARSHGAGLAARARLSGGHAVGQSARGGGRARDLEGPRRPPPVRETRSAPATRRESGLSEAAGHAGVALTVNRVGSMLTAFFTAAPVVDLASAKRADTARYARFFHAMLERGVFLAASQFEAAFVSLAHTDDDLDTAARAAR